MPHERIDPLNDALQRQRALSRWDNEGGAGVSGPQMDPTLFDDLVPSPSSDAKACTVSCTPGSPAESLNQECFCLGVDQQALHAELGAVLGAHGLQHSFAESHPHLFSALPVFVSRRHIEQAAQVVAAIEEVVATDAFRTTVLAWAPEVANFDPGSPGGLLGFDFHLGPEMPRLIEINTNPGGALLNAVLGRAQRACSPEVVPPTNLDQVEDAVLETVLTEWRLQMGARQLGFVVILDASPAGQYLYPEFLLFRQLFLQHGYRADICSPQELTRKDGRLWLGREPVDLVYNRITDFALQEPAQDAIRIAYLAGEVVVTPHPRGHAIYADKRNLSLLGNHQFLVGAGASETLIDVLIAAVPATELLTAENREAMWSRRGQLFFKPAAGFGSKASYRGDKLTRRVWNEIARGTYVAQQIVAPSERHIGLGSTPLKVDIRCYAYRGEVLLYAARMYQGQTTNFRTPGGGFAPVLTSRGFK